MARTGIARRKKELPKGGYRVSNELLIRGLMHERAASMAQLGHQAGVTRQFVSLLLKGERTCSLDVAQAISDYLGKPVNKLFAVPPSAPAYVRSA